MKKLMGTAVLLIIAVVITGFQVPDSKKIFEPMQRNNHLNVEEVTIQKQDRVHENEENIEEKLFIGNAIDFSYTVSVEKKSASLGESIEFIVTATTSTYDFYTSKLRVYTNYNGNAVPVTVELTETTKNVFKGSLVITHEIMSGYYNIDNIRFYTAEEPGHGYQFTVEGNTENLFEVKGTLAGLNPKLSIKTDKAIYVPGDVINVEVTIDMEQTLFEQVSMWFINESGYEGPLESSTTTSTSIALFRVGETNVFKGQIHVNPYWYPGKFALSSVYLYSEQYGLDIEDLSYPIEPMDYEYNNFYRQDFSSSFFSIEGTTIDIDSPTITSISYDKKIVDKENSITFTVKASDAISGIKEGMLIFEEVNMFPGYMRTGKLLPIDDHTLQVVVALDPFMPEPIDFVLHGVQIIDKAGNTAEFYYDEPITGFMMKGYTYPKVGEIYGSNRYSTAVEISKIHTRYNDYKNNYVVITSGSNFPDALASAPLASLADAPILLVQQNRISDSTLNELKRLNPEMVFIIGGVGAVSTEVEEKIKTELPQLNNTIRIMGSNRYSTSAKIADYLQRWVWEEQRSDKVFITSGRDYADALSIGSVAGRTYSPVLLTNGTSLHSDVIEFIKKWNISKATIIGGVAAVGAAVENELKLLGITVERVSGSNRHYTSEAVAKKYFPNANYSIITNGYEFADALAAAPLAAKYNIPILLSNSTRLPKGIENVLNESMQKNGDHSVVVIGGNAAVQPSVRNSISTILNR